VRSERRGRWQSTGPGQRAAGPTSGQNKLPHRALAGCGPPVATEKSFFFSVLFSEYIFYYCFLFSFFSKFHIVFSIQNIPTKILFREFKSYRNFLKSLKFMNFIHVSAANS
jgi:hypothetical protein